MYVDESEDGLYALVCAYLVMLFWKRSCLSSFAQQTGVLASPCAQVQSASEANNRLQAERPRKESQAEKHRDRAIGD